MFDCVFNLEFIPEIGPTSVPIQAVRNPLRNSQIYRCERILFSSHTASACNMFIITCLTEHFAVL